ncbi:MAG: response regulator [Lachnospiraceae bacterium]|nr:response regulator [Lachnospiraceae bacterium]
MSESKMIFIGEKESFISRVLIKKAQEAGAGCGFVPWNINEISANLDGTSLITLFMEDGETPADDVLHYLSDSMDEKGLQMIIVGENYDINTVLKKIREDLVYKVFPRPVDNAEFASTVAQYLEKVDEGELKKSILVVDDDPQYLTMVREWLKGTYKVTMANSGMQAIKWLGKNKADLILLDHEMPVTSGPQVLEMLRSEPETSSIPVMFLTGKGDKDSVMSVVALKPEGYFLKGIQKEELLEKLQEYFILHK